MFQIKDILKATKGKLVSGSLKNNFSGISTDTRTIKKGDLFIALIGNNFDGHKFIEDAVKKGTSGVVSQLNTQYPILNTNLIKVRDTLEALGQIAHNYRMRFGIPFIGVTGSNGKTTTKEMLHRVLGARFSVLKNEGTENNLIGVPKTLLKLDPGHEIAVLELGTNHFGEIKRLAQILKPSTGIITNIGPAHLEFLKSKEGVLREKAALFEVLDKSGQAIVNADDNELSKIKKLRCKIVKFGVEKRCEIKATRIFHHDDGSEFIVNDKYKFKINLLGRHNVYNALAAIAAGFLYKIDYDDIYKALLEFRPANGRMRLRRLEGIDIIDDTYNSNPYSLKMAIEVLSNYSGVGRKILICGDMLELGNSAVRFHSEAGKLVAASGIDYLLCVGRFSEVVSASAVLNGMDSEAVFSCRDNQAVLSALKKIVKEGDLILLKGSRRVRLDEVADALLSFISSKRALVRV